jgi:hypothetical protein
MVWYAQLGQEIGIPDVEVVYNDAVILLQAIPPACITGLMAA